MTDRKTRSDSWTIGAAVEAPARWVATVMLPTDDPTALAVSALKHDGVQIKKKTSRTLAVAGPWGEASVQTTASRGPGGEVSRFILGARTHIKSHSKAADSAVIARLSTRLSVVTRSLAAVSSGNAGACDAVSKVLLEYSCGMAFDLSGIHFPSGKVLDYLSRKVSAEHLHPYFCVLVVPGGASPPRAPAWLTHEVWTSLRVPKSTKLVQADVITKTLQSYQKFVAAGFDPAAGHASRQHELAAFIREARAFVIVAADSAAGVSERARTFLLGAATKCGGLVRDDFGVYDGEDRVVFGAWVKKLAPMPG